MLVHPATLPDEDLLKQCEVRKGRTSGPGGQHRNKVETKVVLRHTPTGIEAQASERRSAVENKRMAVFRLRLELAMGVRSPPAKGDRFGDTRSDLWKSRTTPEGRIVCNPSHDDFPSLLAEALDIVAQAGADPTRAALRLCCTPTQLVRFVKKHPQAMRVWNQWREVAQQSPLH